jgi:hypothetical protein
VAGWSLVGSAIGAARPIPYIDPDKIQIEMPQAARGETPQIEFK